MSPRKKKSWPYSAGQRASSARPESSKVRVYDRPDRPGIFFMTRAWVTTPSGRPEEVVLPNVTTKEAARLLADATANERERAILEGRTEIGTHHRTTLGELLKAYHSSAEAGAWRPKTRDDKDRNRVFWEHHLGKDQLVEEITTAEVRTIAQRETRRRKVGTRTERKHLEYIRAAVRWGRIEARLYETEPLLGLKLPDYQPETEGLVYSQEEVAKLVTPHEDVDWRATLAVNIAYDTGRRIGAIRHLTTEDLAVDEGRLFLHFRKEYDKGHRSRWVPVSEKTALLIAAALEDDLVEEWGWLFPEGRLDHDDPRDKPMGTKAMIELLHHAEEVRGVAVVAGRGYHGLKRTHVTVSMEEAGGDTSLVGDVTGNVSADLLRHVYRQQDRRRILRQVDAVRRHLEDAEGPESTRESTQSPEPSDDASPEGVA